MTQARNLADFSNILQAGGGLEDLIPDSDATYDLGSSSKAWAEVHADKVLTDTFEDRSASKSIDAAYVTDGTAKAWIIFDGTGTVASRDSFNVSSLTDDGVGLYTVGLTNNFASADYASTVGSTRSGSQAADRAASGQHATSSFLVHCRNTNTNSDADQDELSGVAHGDLA